MSWSIHHVNLEARDVRKTAGFYAAMLGMEEHAWAFPASRGYLPGDPDKLALFGDRRDSHSGLHLIAPDAEFAAKNDLTHNPSVGGHVAFEVDDLEAVIARLRAAGIRYSLTGEFAIPGMRHLYVEDPDGNLIEVNERLKR
ncbi:MAG: VOC family protein [Pseudomonadota bacterium]